MHLPMNRRIALAYASESYFRIPAERRRQKICKRSKSHDILSTYPRTLKFTEHNRCSSALLSLPPELRIQIYDYCYAPHAIFDIWEDLHRDDHDLVYSARLYGGHTAECDRHENTCACFLQLGNMLALSLTCRNLYTDTIHYLYAHHTFRFNDNRLNLSLPTTIPTKHLRTISSLCLTFDTHLLIDAMGITSSELSETSLLGSPLKYRKAYEKYWYFLATTLSNLQTLRITINHHPSNNPAFEKRVWDFLLRPFHQPKEDSTKSLWSDRLTLFEVMLRSVGPYDHEPWHIVRDHRCDGASIFLREWCDCAFDCRQCIECRNGEEYALRRATEA